MDNNKNNKKLLPSLSDRLSVSKSSSSSSAPGLRYILSRLATNFRSMHNILILLHNTTTLGLRYASSHLDTSFNSIHKTCYYYYYRILLQTQYRVFQKKLHKVCHVINFEPFVLGLCCLNQSVQQRLLLTDR